MNGSAGGAGEAETTSSRPCVFLIDNSKAMTGAFKSALVLAKLLEDFEFVFCVPEGSGVVTQLRAEGFECHTFDFLEVQRNLRCFFYLPRLLANSWKLHCLAKAKQPIIFHINDLYNMCGVVLKLLNPQVALVYHVRLLRSSYIGPLYWAFAGVIKRVADRVILVSKAAQDDFGAGDKGSILLDCLSEKTPDLLPRDPREEVQIVYLANYIPGKGHDLALDVFARAYRRDSRLRLRFIGRYSGTDLYFQQLRSKAKDAGLEAVVEFSGEVAEPAEALTQGDIFLNCSESESFSRTTLEALQVGLPVVVFDSGGVRELFQEGEAGFLIPLRDTERAADAVLKLGASPELRKRLGEAARRHAETRFSAHAYQAEMRMLYQNLTTANRTADQEHSI